jgi:glyoxylase-like metal-dependent hydrolase (beta-lactamase superfamily II)
MGEKMKIKVISVLIACLVVAILAGCSYSTQKATADTSTKEVTVATATDTALATKKAESNKELPSSDTFSSQRISDNTIRIFGKSGELMYLVEGTEKAALIDTGSGDGNLREYVEKITSKPIVVLLTHGHIDNASGASEFNEVYINHADDAIYKEHVYDRLKGKAKPASDFKALKSGDIYDLGGTTLEIFSAAGHTPGQMAILFKEAKILLLGDAANNFTFLDKKSFGISDYEKSMKELLAKTKDRFDKAYFSHGSGDAPKETLAGVIQVCEDIKAGKVDNEPYEFLGQQVLIAKEIDGSMNRIDGGVGNIVYIKEKIL